MDGLKMSGVNTSEFQLTPCIAHSSTLNAHKVSHWLSDDDVWPGVERKMRVTREYVVETGDEAMRDDRCR